MGTGLRRLRLNILKIINILLELGLYKPKELYTILELIHDKTPMLFVEEKDVLTDGFDCPEEESHHVYTPLYHEMIACIVNQATVLYTDEAYMDCIKKRGKKGKINIGQHFMKSIYKLYFHKKNVFNKLCFNLFDGILNSLGPLINEDGSPNFLEIYASRSTFMNIFDINNDLFL